MRDGVVLSAFAKRSESPLRLDAITWLECVTNLNFMHSPFGAHLTSTSDVANLASSSCQ